MAKYKVTDHKTGKEIQPGDTVTDPTGKPAIFQGVTRGPHEHQGSPRVMVGDRETYCWQYSLNVETIEP
jgi:hypothetical protein